VSKGLLMKTLLILFLCTFSASTFAFMKELTHINCTGNDHAIQVEYDSSISPKKPQLLIIDHKKVESITVEDFDMPNSNFNASSSKINSEGKLISGITSTQQDFNFTIRDGEANFRSSLGIGEKDFKLDCVMTKEQKLYDPSEVAHDKSHINDSLRSDPNKEAAATKSTKGSSSPKASQK
jgi:hypothetical protein